MKRSVFFLCVCLCCAGIVYAQQPQTPEMTRDEAFNKIKIGIQLMQQGHQIMASQQNDQTLQAGMKLYIEAGKNFEQAKFMLESLSAEYVSPDDIKNCDQALQTCIVFVKQCQEQLQKMYQQQSR